METKKEGAMTGESTTQMTVKTPVPVSQETIENIEEGFSDLLELANSTVENILPETRFLELDEGSDFFGIYQGKKNYDFDGSGGKFYAQFLGKDGNLYLSANWKLLQIPDDKVGFPMRIVYLGEKEIKGGKRVKQFNVFVFKFK